jgi:hypothetical protein
MGRGIIAADSPEWQPDEEMPASRGLGSAPEGAGEALAVLLAVGPGPEGTGEVSQPGERAGASASVLIFPDDGMCGAPSALHARADQPFSDLRRASEYKKVYALADGAAGCASGSRTSMACRPSCRMTSIHCQSVSNVQESITTPAQEGGCRVQVARGAMFDSTVLAGHAIVGVVADYLRILDHIDTH